MSGWHEVCVFHIRGFDAEKPYDLPEGWKPFSATIQGGDLWVTARRWHGLDKKRENLTVAELRAKVPAVAELSPTGSDRPAGLLTRADSG